MATGAARQLSQANSVSDVRALRYTPIDIGTRFSRHDIAKTLRELYGILQSS